MKSDLVSVIIPVYNVEAYLNDCIWSVRNQTYANLEIIIVNDKTPDGSMKIARRHAQEDSRIVILEHDVNKKLGAARNTGMQYAHGRYVMFLDSDDVYTLDAVEVLHNRICESGASFVCGRMMWKKDEEIFPVEYIEQKLIGMVTYSEENVRDMPSDKWFLGQACNRMFDKTWLDRKKISFPEGVFWEDMLFSAKVWIEADYICAVDHIVYIRTERNDESNPSITQSYGKKKYLDRDALIDGLFAYLSQKRENYLVKKELSNSISSYEARQIMKRVCTTTKNIVPLADEDIKPWVQEWYNEHSIRSQELIQSLR